MIMGCICQMLISSLDVDTAAYLKGVWVDENGFVFKYNDGMLVDYTGNQLNYVYIKNSVIIGS